MYLAARLATADPSRARQLLDEAAQAAALADNPFARNMAMVELASVHAQQGDYLAAGRCLIEMVRSTHNPGDHMSTLQGLRDLACVLATLGDDEPVLVTLTWTTDHGLPVVGLSRLPICLFRLGSPQRPARAANRGRPTIVPTAGRLS